MFNLTVMIEESANNVGISNANDFARNNNFIKDIVRISATASSWESCLANLRNAVDYIDTGHVGDSNV